MLFELPNLLYVNAREPAEAVSLLHEHGDAAKIIGGSTDLLGLMKDRIRGPELRVPEVLVDIKGIPTVSGITYHEGVGLNIGAAVTLSRLAMSDVVKERYSLLSQAALQVGTTQLRNMGTVGGNLCQRPRCIYFRHPDFVCFKKGGKKCFAAAGEHRYYHAIFNNGKCVMAHPSDLAPALMALQSRIKIAGPSGEREVPVEEFFLGPNNLTETVLRTDEFITQIRVPDRPVIPSQLFLKQRITGSSDFALSSVAAVAQMSGGVCEDARIVLGGVAPAPLPASAAVETIKGKRLNEALISQAADASVEGARPLPLNRYKVDLASTLIKRALKVVCNLCSPGQSVF
jgi:xanthine dehydrogenase YagS FAD-binding subunit